MSTVAFKCTFCNTVVIEVENSSRHDIWHQEEVVCIDCYDDKEV